MRQLTKYSQRIVWENLCIRYLWRLKVEQKHQHQQQQQQQPQQRQKMTTTLVNHTLLRTPFFQFYFGFLVFTMRLVLLSTIYIFTDVKSVSVYFFVLRFICLSFSHFDSLLCCCHLTTFYRYSQNTTDWYEMFVCVGLVGVHFSLFRCISVSLLAFKRAICHLFTSSTPINFIYFFASFFLLSLLLEYFFVFFFSFVFVRLIQHSFSRSTLFDCWLFDFFAWKMD